MPDLPGLSYPNFSQPSTRSRPKPHTVIRCTYLCIISPSRILSPATTATSPSSSFLVDLTKPSCPVPSATCAPPHDVCSTHLSPLFRSVNLPKSIGSPLSQCLHHKHCAYHPLLHVPNIAPSPRRVNTVYFFFPLLPPSLDLQPIRFTASNTFHSPTILGPSVIIYCVRPSLITVVCRGRRSTPRLHSAQTFSLLVQQPNSATALSPSTSRP